MRKPLEQTYLKSLEEELSSRSVEFRKNVKLSVLSSFKIGGESPLLVEPTNNDQIFETFQVFQKFQTPFRILGGGSNLLISDFPDDFVTLRLSGEFKEFTSPNEGFFHVGSATNTTPTFRNISKMGYTGSEFLSTIPGWTGGAVIQNAGCYGGELFDLVESIEFFDLEKFTFHKKTPKEISHGYRFTEFLQKKNSLILWANFQLPKGNLEEIEISLKEKMNKRNSSQPENRKSAGSVFKNPKLKKEDGSPLKSWELIDRVGLRGMVRGNAQISPVHCNFIVNLGEASAADVYFLVCLVQEKVQKETGILLEREIEFFGEMGEKNIS